jgi:Cu/Ag efflux protein CusF
MEASMSGTGTRSALPLAMTALFLGLVACSSQPKPTEAQTPAQSPQTQLQRYDLKGKVVSVDKSAKKLTVDHEAIPGFMGAMTMPYPVKDEHLLDNLSPGDQVTAKVVSGAGEFWLENIATTNAAPSPK